MLAGSGVLLLGKKWDENKRNTTVNSTQKNVTAHVYGGIAASVAGRFMAYSAW
jgi:hypothetical protein